MSYFELASKMSRGGRRNIKMSLLEIYSDKTQTNKNGIHWEEKYVMNNIDSIKEIRIDDETKNTINKYLDLYYDRYTGLYLNSKDFLKKLM